MLRNDRHRCLTIAQLLRTCVLWEGCRSVCHTANTVVLRCCYPREPAQLADMRFASIKRARLLIMSISAGTRSTPSVRGILSRESLTSDTALLIYLALISFVGHMLVAGNYGYFRDELYYLADGKHLAFGYVDQPLLIGWLSALTNLLFNDNLVAIHIIPALAGACLIVITGLMARELGGGRLAQVLAALASMFALVFMAT